MFVDGLNLVDDGFAAVIRDVHCEDGQPVVAPPGPLKLICREDYRDPTVYIAAARLPVPAERPILEFSVTKDGCPIESHSAQWAPRDGGQSIEYIDGRRTLLVRGGQSNYVDAFFRIDGYTIGLALQLGPGSTPSAADDEMRKVLESFEELSRSEWADLTAATR